MRAIPKEQVLRRIQAENTWWQPPHTISQSYHGLRRRAHFDLFYPLVRDVSVRRAVVLMGPRRVGKTVMIHHAVQKLVEEGVDPKRICYLSVDHPIYNGCGLQDLLDYYLEASSSDFSGEPLYVFFDEIQYLKGWEIHLKSLVDSYQTAKFVASGSAAAALKLKSYESGAGRFTDFLLPPLTFHEYLDLLGKADLVRRDEKGRYSPAGDILQLNTSFIHYLNYGGYPEVVFSEKIQSDPARFVKGDIVDKVLLRDLPGLYGIQDIQELNYLFTSLAFNTANEISLVQIAQSSGVAKNTIKKYIEYLEAAFLMKIVHRIDRNAKRFQRANFFKVYLTNPSIRSALFSPISGDDEHIGSLAETGVFSQWFHGSAPQLYYARWANGEVDMAGVGPKQKASWAVEVKWSDRFAENPYELKSLLEFCQANDLRRVTVTSRTVSATKNVRGVEITFVPTSVYCYGLGANLVSGRQALTGLVSVQSNDI